jgi:tetratricopeptide (TPR) repeat protein
MVLGRYLMGIEKYPEANKVYTEILQREKDNIYALYDISMSLYNLDLHEQALPYITKASKLEPTNIDILHDRCLIILHLGKHLRAIGMEEAGVARCQESVSCFKEVLKLDEENGSALYNIGHCLNYLQRHNDALQYLNGALNTAYAKLNRETICRDITLALFGQKKESEAIAYIDDSLELDPNNFELLYLKGNALYSSGKHSMAVEYYDKALAALPPNHHLNSIVLHNKGLAFYSLGKYEDAITCYDRALIDMSKPPYVRAMIYYNKSKARVKQGNSHSAMILLERAIYIDSSFRYEAKMDKDFEGLQDNEQFRNILK